MFRVLQPKLFDEVPELGMGFHFGIDDAGNGYMALNGEIALTIDDLIAQAMAEKFRDSAQRAEGLSLLKMSHLPETSAVPEASVAH